MSRVFCIHKRPCDKTDNVPIILSCKAVLLVVADIVEMNIIYNMVFHCFKNKHFSIQTAIKGLTERDRNYSQ